MACGAWGQDRRGNYLRLSLHEPPRKGGTRHPRRTGTTHPSSWETLCPPSPTPKGPSRGSCPDSETVLERRRLCSPCDRSCRPHHIPQRWGAPSDPFFPPHTQTAGSSSPTGMWPGQGASTCVPRVPVVTPVSFKTVRSCGRRFCLKLCFNLAKIIIKKQQSCP